MAKSSRGKSKAKSTKRPGKAVTATRSAAKKIAKKSVAKAAGRAVKYVYSFGGGRSDGKAAMKNLLGGKGANLAEMAGLGLPVPPGLTITTEVCTYYYDNKRTYPSVLKQQVLDGLAKVESITGKKFGDPSNPLLVSVRSGARASMPGMMDTVLNLGLNDETVQGLISDANTERFAWDSYRRFVQMYGDVVLYLKPVDKKQADPFEEILERKKHARGAKLDTDLTAADLKELVAEFKAIIKEKKGKDFPNDPHEQLWGAIGAVFGSWQNDRAIVYRRLYGIPDAWGTAVNVQAMVFGNLGDDCATGVGFSRDPATGERAFYGDYLVNAQGEDVVAGIRTPQSLSKKASIEDAAAQGIAEADRLPSLEETMPAPRASPRPTACRRSRRSCRASTSSSRRSRRASKSTTATCRTSSSPSKVASSTCSRRGTGSAPRPPRSRSPSTW